MLEFKLSEVLKDGPTGRARLFVPGYNYAFDLPNHARDFHVMGRVQRWLVGSLTPGMTWRNGIAINEMAMSLGSPRYRAQQILHESVHWWQLWRRMGPTDFPATYGWQGLTGLVRYGSAHLHEKHMVEVEARNAANAILAFVESLPIESVLAPRVFDTLPWFEEHYPVIWRP